MICVKAHARFGVSTGISGFWAFSVETFFDLLRQSSLKIEGGKINLTKRTQKSPYRAKEL